VASWAALVVAEISVPCISERAGMTTEHYGLFTIILRISDVTPVIEMRFDVYEFKIKDQEVSTPCPRGASRLFLFLFRRPAR
jgi:hypothetical protein